MAPLSFIVTSALLIMLINGDQPYLSTSDASALTCKGLIDVLSMVQCALQSPTGPLFKICAQKSSTL